jgi:hypothetical protein
VERKLTGTEYIEEIIDEIILAFIIELSLLILSKIKNCKDLSTGTVIRGSVQPLYAFRIDRLFFFM